MTGLSGCRMMSIADRYLATLVREEAASVPGICDGLGLGIGGVYLYESVNHCES